MSVKTTIKGPLTPFDTEMAKQIKSVFTENDHDLLYLIYRALLLLLLRPLTNKVKIGSRGNVYGLLTS
jgi:hypothetical protein